MSWWQRRRLRKHIESLDFPTLKEKYGDTGEYCALCWLKAYVKGYASAEPFDLVISTLQHSPNGINSYDRDYLLTLLQWC